MLDRVNAHVRRRVRANGVGVRMARVGNAPHIVALTPGQSVAWLVQVVVLALAIVTWVVL